MQSKRRCTNIWLVTAELSVAARKPLQTNRELDVSLLTIFWILKFGKLGVIDESE